MQSKPLTCHLFKANCLRQDSLAKQDIMLSVCERMSEVPWLCRIQGALPSRQNVLFTEERNVCVVGRAKTWFRETFMGAVA